MTAHDASPGPPPLAALVKPPAASDAVANGQVLVIVNEPELRHLLLYCLTAAGFRARLAAPHADGGREVMRAFPDVVLLDSRLPERRATEVWREIRAAVAGEPMPAVIMFITGESDIDPRLGLDYGPCDFILYPLGVRDLVLRVDHLVRQRREALAAVPSAGRQCIGPLELDLDRHTAQVDGAPIALSPTEIRVLAYLIENRSRVCTRAELLRDVWGYRSGISSRTTDIHINRLRGKLGAAAPLIETLRGAGYRLSERFPVVDAREAHSKP